MLPDDVLLEAFDSYVDDYVDEDFGPFKESGIRRWITLAHVCRRWRSLVFQSPRRLNLRLLCTANTPARDTLEIWPPLPLVIRNVNDIFSDEPSNADKWDNIAAALEHNDRVCRILLSCYSSLQFKHITDSAAIQKPFPELTDLHLGRYRDDGSGPRLPDSFLGGTAPRLRSLKLDNVPFLGLPKLLLSSTHLVYLGLYGISRSGYISPEVTATSLSALTNLEFFQLQFRDPRPRPALDIRRPPPPLTRSILPRLTMITFKGASEYLEDILARVDAPRLNELDIVFFNEIIFDTPQLFQFISRRPTLREPENGHIKFSIRAIIVKFPSQTSDHGGLRVEIPCTASDWQLSSLEQICTSSLPHFSTLEKLYIFEDQIFPPHWKDDVENTLWLDLLRSFVAVKDLYLSEGFVPHVAPALQELVEGGTTEVLSTLENIFLEGFQTSGPLQEGIQKFVAARQLTNLPVTVSLWDRESMLEYAARVASPYDARCSTLY